MSHYKKIQAIRIYLDTVEIEDTSIGIYTNVTSEIRLSEEILFGVSLAWTSGLIAQNGIGAIAEGGDLTRGGDVANLDGVTFELVHTNQWILELGDLGVYLPGRKCEIWEFSGTEFDNDSEYANVIFTGVIDDISWNETVIGIPIKNAAYKRNALISVPLIAGSADIKPVTFGALYPPDSTNVNILAKLIRTKEGVDDTVYTNKFFTGSGENIKIFPVAANVNNTQFNFYTSGITPSFPILTATDCYVIINSGDGKDQIREVVNFVPSDTDIVTCTVKTAWHYEDDGATTIPSVANTNDRSWVQFLFIDRTFVADFWKCYKFLTKEGIQTTTPELYAYNDPAFERIADFGFTINSSDNNTLDVDGKQYTENIDTLKSFLILPVNSIDYETESTLKYSGSFLAYDYSSFVRPASMGEEYGVYVASASLASYYKNIRVTDNTIYTPASCYDRDYSTYADRRLAFTNIHADNSDHVIVDVLKFGLPTMPKNVEIKNIYVGIRAEKITNSNQIDFVVAFKRFKYSKTYDSILSGNTSTYIAGTTITYDSLPDYYYLTNAPSTASLNFYRKSLTVTPDTHQYGYEWYKVSITREEYEAFECMAIINGITILHTDDTVNHAFKIYDLAMVFELEDKAISKEVYSPMSGRIFNSTWGTRKTSAELINNPVDIIEHLCRLQNWSETGETGVVWGNAYAALPLIRTNTDPGSFDNTSLADVKTFRPAWQVFDKEKAQTKIIKKELCKTYNLISRIDENGYECVYTMDREYPSEIIQFADIKGDIGKIQEAKIQDVFCEPVINYQWNTGSQKFEKQLKIYNIAYYSDSSKWSDCSYGFNNQADAETILGPCFDLYSRYKFVEECQADFSDQITIISYEDALHYLKKKIEIMKFKRVELSVFYDKGKDYFFGKHLLLKLPHQTKNYELECIVERLEKSKNNNNVSLQLIIMDDVALAWQNTVDTGTEYQDHETTGTEYQAIAS